MEPGQYTFILVAAFVISALDAFSIGANDVANCFATSVASKSVTLKTALMIALFTEFLGAVLLGSGVADTIRKGIIDVKAFKDPGILMAGMFTANCGSSIVTIIATLYGLPVSTTHAVVGGIIGTGIAAHGFDTVIWGWSASGKGVSVIIASWFISPTLSGIVAILLYQITLRLVLKRENSFEVAKKAIPFYFFFTSALILFYFAYKGAPVIKKMKLAGWQVALISLVPSTFIGLMAHFLLMPYYIVPKIEEKFKQKKEVEEKNETPDESNKAEDIVNIHVGDDASSPSKSNSQHSSGPSATKNSSKLSTFDKFSSFVQTGLEKDVISIKTDKQQELHDEVNKFDPKTEEVFSFLQVVTAACASFSHGANDIANALAPMAVVYTIWNSGDFPSKKFAIPFWQVCYCAFMLNVGLFVLGWRLMQQLGNNLTYHSPSRGFNMETAAMCTVLTASRLGLPVSTTHCIVGATAGVAIAEGNSKTFHWSKFYKIFLGWIFTVPAGAVVSGLLLSFMINSPTKEYEVMLANGTIVK